MALAARPMHFPAYAPLDEATRPELLEPGQAVLLAENVRPTENGGYETRRGFTALPLTRFDATARSVGHRLFAHGTAGKQIGVIDGTYCDLYDAGKSVWKNVGRVPDVDFDVTPLPAAGMSLAATEIAYANGYIAVVYLGTTGNATTAESHSYASLINATTGAVVRAPEAIDVAVASPGNRLIYVASYSDRYFIAFFANGTGGLGGGIGAYYLDTSTATTINAGWTYIGVIDGDWDDVSTPSVCSLSDRVAIALGNLTGGTDRLTVRTVTTAGVVETRTVNTNSTAVRITAIDGSIADTLWVSWNETTSVRLVGLDADALATDLATVATVITTGSAADRIYVASNTSVAGNGRSYASSGSTSYVAGFETNAGAVSPDAQVSFLSTCMVGRPRMYGGRYYANFRTSTSRTSFTGDVTQGNAVLADWTDDVSFVRPVANVAPGLVLNEDNSGLVGGGLDVASGTKVYAVLNIKKSSAAFAPSLITYDFAASTRWQAVSHNGTTLLGGGLLAHFDGKRVAELGFLSRPATPTTSVGGASGFTSTNGVRYVAVYEEIDGAGNWCVSGISDPSANTGAVANQTVTVSTTPLTLSARLASTDTLTGTRVVFYRTTDGGSPPYYRCGVAYNTTTAAVTLADTMSDATLATKVKLYAPNLPSSVGEKFNRLGSVGLRHLVSCNGVLVGARGSVLYNSGQPVDGEETWMSPLFQSPVDGDGDITGLAAQDGTIFVFKRRAVFAVSVEPPADNGSVGGLGVPRRLAVDVGCIDARSIVVTSLGIFFQSERGIELLTRAQSVEFVGDKAQDTLANYPVCSAATLDTVRDVVYFELAAGESSGLVTGGGRTLIFDLSLRAWVSTDRRPSYAGVADTPAQAGCMLWDGSTYRYAWLETGGRVRPEQSAYYDSGSADSFIAPRVEYPPFKFGLQQRARLWRAVALVERYSAAGFKVEHLWDWSTSYSASDDKTWTEAQTASKRQLHWTLKTGERQSVRFRVSATAPATLGTGRAFAFIGFSVDGAPKQGSSKGTPNLDPSARQ